MKVIARYAYDVLGRRIVKRDSLPGNPAQYIRMLYRGAHVIAEADYTDSLTFAYTWRFGTDNLVAIHRYSDGGDWYAVTDILGSVRGLTKRDGTWVVSWRYGVNGFTQTLLDSAGTAPFDLRYRWTGREYDRATGLYYFRARYYDPGAGRFIQEDPIRYSGGENLYAFGEGNPINRDPSGLDWAMDPTGQGWGNECWRDNTCYADRAGSGSGGDGWGSFNSYGDQIGRWNTQLRRYMQAVEALYEAAQTLAQTGTVTVTAADGRRVTFSAGPGANLGGVYPIVLVDVILAGLGTPSVVSAVLSSGWRPPITGQGTAGLSASGNRIWMHAAGRAVDISMINGLPVGDPGALHVVSAYQNSLMSLPFGAEVYGPAGVSRRQGSAMSRWTSAGAGTAASHRDHIHYSTWGPPGYWP